jgi:hypothetical protein
MSNDREKVPFGIQGNIHTEKRGLQPSGTNKPQGGKQPTGSPAGPPPTGGGTGKK